VGFKVFLICKANIVVLIKLLRKQKTILISLLAFQVHIIQISIIIINQRGVGQAILLFLKYVIDTFKTKNRKIMKTVVQT
jgi:hypothetical protein